MPLFHLYKLLNSHKFIHNLESNIRLKLLKTVIAATLAATITFANSFTIELPLNPIQNTLDINGNHYPDFFAFGNSDIHRSLHIFDVTPKGLSKIWSFSLNENQNGYIVDAVLSDFDGDGNSEILAAVELENEPGKLYLFQSEEGNFSKNPSKKFSYPDAQNNMRLTQLKTIDWDNDGDNEIAMVMGSPNRSAMICDIHNGEFEVMEKIAHDFVQNTFGLLLLSTGDFDGDGIDDLIVISNGIEPTSFQYLSTSSPQEVAFGENGPIIFITDPIDINNDQIDDFLFLTGEGNLFSNEWGKAIPLDHSNYNHIYAEFSIISNSLSIFAFSQNGDIQKFQLSRKNTLISMDAYYPSFLAEEIINPKILYLNKTQEVVVFHNGNNPEVSTLELEPFIDYSKQRRSDGREANIIIKSELLYRHPIEKIADFNFSEFKTDSLPNGMEFNLDAFALDWTPTLNQLGFHELNYHTAFNISGELLINLDEGTVVTPTSSDTSLTNSYLFYVNDQPFFATNNSIDFLVVNNDTLNANFSIKDRNVDAIINVGVNTSQTATHSYTNPPAEEDSPISDSETESPSDDVPEEEAEVEDAIDESGAEEEEESSDTEAEPVENEDAELADEIESTDPNGDDDYSEIKRRESQFQWIPDVDPGLYPFTLWVDDLHNSDSLRISVRVHPRIYLDDNQTDFILTVGNPFEYKLNVTQKIVADSHYNFSIRNVPENMYIDSTGSVYWVPVVTQVDNHYITIDVSDGIATESITLTLFVNDPPIISKRPAQYLILEKTDIWEYTLRSFDANITADITWELLDAPHTMTLDSLGNLRWMINEVDYWNYSVQISDGIDSTQFTNTIYSNYLPRITSIPIESVIWVDEYNYQTNVKDDNQYAASKKDAPNILTYSFDESPSTMSISDSGLVIWQPLEIDEGNHKIIINVNDGLVDVKQEYSLLVEGPPTITIADSLAIPVGDTLQIQFTHKNFKNADNLKFNTDGLPKSLQVDDSTGIVNWVPTIKDVGLFKFKATIQNGVELAEKPLKLFVYQYPELNLDTPTEAYVGLTYIYDVQAFDMFGEYIEKNGGEIRLHSETMSDIKFDSDTHTIRWSPTEEHLGEHEFTVDVLDQFGLTTSVSHYVSVFMSPCELCKSAKRERKSVKQVLTPVFKKDTPDKVTRNASSIQTTVADSIVVAPVDSLVVPQDSLIIPIDTLSTPVDTTVITQDSLSLPVDTLTIKLDSTITTGDMLISPMDSIGTVVDSVKVDSLTVPAILDSTVIDTTTE